MRLTPLFLVLAVAAPFSLAHAQEAPHPEAPHDESVPHTHAESKPEADETLIDYFWRKSDDAFHGGDYPRAIALHRAIVTLDPTQTESYSVGAWLLWSLGKPDEAMAFLAEGLKANPKDPEMWDAAAQHYDLQKKFTESEAAYAKAVELSGKDADQMLRRRYAHSAEHTGNWSKSAEIWRALVAEFPNDAVNKNNLARVEKSMAEAQTATAKTMAQRAAVAVGAAGLVSAMALAPLRLLNRKV